MLMLYVTLKKENFGPAFEFSVEIRDVNGTGLPTD
jgi:hypothetical protein